MRISQHVLAWRDNLVLAIIVIKLRCFRQLTSQKPAAINSVFLSLFIKKLVNCMSFVELNGMMIIILKEMVVSFKASS
jgi:hypothetical protein